MLTLVLLLDIDININLTVQSCSILLKLHALESTSIDLAYHSVRLNYTEYTLQCLQTLDELHGCAKYSHLDLSKNNIMIRSDSADKWDQLRLLDFGYSMKCVTGVSPVATLHSDLLQRILVSQGLQVCLYMINMLDLGLTRLNPST